MRFFLVFVLFLPTMAPASSGGLENIHRQACEKNDAKACFNLAVIYDVGDGVKKDGRKAAEFYKKACDGNNADACANLGVLFYEGDGVEADKRRAAEFFQKTCDENFAGACFELGPPVQQG